MKKITVLVLWSVIGLIWPVAVKAQQQYELSCAVGSFDLLSPTYDSATQKLRSWVCADPFGVVSSPVFGTGSGTVTSITCTAPLACTPNPIVGAGTIAGTNLAVTTNRIDQNNAATTSTQFFSKITDETGTGVVVGSASPTLTGVPLAPTPALGDDSATIATTGFAMHLSGASFTGTTTVRNLTLQNGTSSLLTLDTPGVTFADTTTQTTAYPGKTVSIISGGTSALPDTTIVTIGGSTTSGRIQANVYCDGTTATATATLTVKYTDSSNTAQTVTGTGAACTTLGIASQQMIGPLFIRAKNATVVTWAIAVANSPTYDASVVWEPLTTN